MQIRQAVFLVGGRGTRLGAISGSTPKPLLAVGGRPFLDILIENVARFGVRKILLLAGHLGDQVAERYREWGLWRGLDIISVIEPEQAGTAGALRYAQEHLDDIFYLFNGDSLFDVNILHLATLEGPEGWIGKVALRQVPDASRYGQVLLKGNLIVDLRERGDNGPGLVNGGVYIIKRAILDRVVSMPCSIERDIFSRLAREQLLCGEEFDGFFLDIGIPDDFMRAQNAIPAHLKRPAVFFDRDGVLNINHGYVSRPESFDWIDGAIPAIKCFNDRGYYVFVITNQAGIARGYYNEETMHTLHDWMADELASHGAHVDAFYYCPHHPDGVVARYTAFCDCRKPAPGMLKAALRDWSVDVARSLLVGDKQSDLDAAHAAGIKGVLFPGGNLHDFMCDANSAAG